MNSAPRSPLSSAVDGLCDRFERRLQAGERTTLEDWLTEAGAEAPATLPELAAVELDHWIRAGDAVTAADYFTRFPQLRTDAVWAVALVRVEYSAVRAARPGVSDRDILDRYADLSTHSEWGRGPWPVRAGADTTFTTSGPCADAPADTAVGTAPLLAPAREPGEIGRLAQYRVLKVLGQGGMGIVYEAEDTQLQRPAALKLMLPHLAQDPTARMRFLAEARAAASPSTRPPKTAGRRSWRWNCFAGNRSKGG